MPEVPNAIYRDTFAKQPLIVGIGNIIADTIQDLNLAAGLNVKNLTATPQGHLYVYKHISFRYVGTAPARMVMSIIISGTEYEIFAQTPPVTNVLYDRQGEWAVKAGDNLRVTMANATLNNDVFIYAVGYDILIGAK